MTNQTIALKEYLDNLRLTENSDFLREAVQMLSQVLIEIEAEEQIGAGKFERSSQRKTQRNGYRHRKWKTRVGEVNLSIPKLRKGSFFPSLLEPRKRSEKALLTTIQTAYVNGVSTRKVDKLIKSLGLAGVDKSQVSRINKGLDEMVNKFRNRDLQSSYPYVWLDATMVKVRENHQIVSQALAIAVGVDETGERHLLGFDLGSGESEAFWLSFLRSMRYRGLASTKLVISDANIGLKNSIDRVLAGTAWQRCTVHFKRNVLAQVARKDRKQVAFLLQFITDQPDPELARAHLRKVGELMEKPWSKAAEIVFAAEDEVLTYKSFPLTHHRSIHSNNPVESINKELKRRFKVVSIFPDRESVFRLAGTLLLERDEEWRGGRRLFSLASMQELLYPEQEMNQTSISLESLMDLEVQVT